jgi:carboxyl-terminal processing protease
MLIWLIIALVVAALAYKIYRDRETPESLYDHVWMLVATQFYDTERLRDWQQWRHRFDTEIKTRDEAIARTTQMLQSLNDPFTMLIDRKKLSTGVCWETGECVGVGFSVITPYENVTLDSCSKSTEKTGASCKYPTIVHVIHNSPAAKAGLKSGDLLLAIDGEATDGQPLPTIMHKLHGKDGTPVKLLIHSDGVEKLVTLNRQFVWYPTAIQQMLDKRIGYLRVTHFLDWDERFIADEAEHLKDAKAIILDMRDNPGGLMSTAVRAARLFIKEGLVTTTVYRVPGTLEAPEFETRHLKFANGRLVEETEGGSTKSYASSPRLPLPDPIFAGKPIVVLINENSASAAELVAGALRDTAGATIIGTKTFGKGVAQNVVEFGMGVQVRYTIGKYLLPSGYWPGDGGRDKRGIDPSVSVDAPSKLFDFGSTQDTQLKSAVEFLDQKLSEM